MVESPLCMARYQCQNYVCLNVLNLYWHQDICRDINALACGA